MAKDFFWGSATSAHQIEGGNRNDFSEAGLDAGRACDSYNLYERDFDLAKDLGQNAHRFSLEWSRIEPEEGRFSSGAIEHYRKVIRSMKERGLEPFVTLWHFTNPVWFAAEGGWESDKAVQYFTRYVDYVMRNLRGEARFFITLNEPEIYVDYGYFRKKWPPKSRSISGANEALRNLQDAHLAAYAVIKDSDPAAQVGLATNLVGGSWLVRRMINLPNFRTLRKCRRYLDFIGLNYYLRVRALEALLNIRPAGRSVSDLGWEIFPEGLYQNLMSLREYQLPVYVTENGIADAADAKRGDFIKDHIGWMKKAMNEGADVRGYFHWSLIDNFEWHHGSKPRFGLAEVDYATMNRKARPSAAVYKKICEDDRLAP